MTFKTYASQSDTLKIILRMPMDMIGENTIHQEKAMRILVVDDEKDVREMLRDFLEIEGFEVFEAAEAKSAVEIAREHSLDVVLTDLRMPGPDGLGVLKEIRRIRPEAAVLILTGYPSVGNAFEALELGCDGYVNKPVRLDHLRYMIYQGLIKRKWEREHLGG